MNRLILATLAAGLGLLTFAGGPAFGQSGYPHAAPNYGPGYRPQLSPYLDITRGGNAGINYFLGTLPEIDRRANQRAVRSSLQTLDREVNAPPSQENDILNPLAGTGHPTGFQEYGGYFGTTTLRPGAAQGTAGQPRRRR